MYNKHKKPTLADIHYTVTGVRVLGEAQLDRMTGVIAGTGSNFTRSDDCIVVLNTLALRRLRSDK